ncbi:hypothetical protein F5883DRAFT_436985 [Diaporthe sp. PMI_573]|nr:hypothetical protein F5883DRAFT_436985 [Diaporthaceae sp. PMI_573]
MDKCWFRLRQTYYPAPDAESLGKKLEAKNEGSMLPGHFIPTLNGLHKILNRGNIIDFPGDMRVWRTKTIKFKWNNSTSSDFGGSVSGDIPIAAASGLTVQASIDAAFRSSVQNYVEFDSLDCYIVDPVKAYITLCVAEGTPVGDHIKEEKGKGIFNTWKVFMITGILIARGAKTGSKEHAESKGHADANASGSSTQNVSGSQATDFVWAIRLAKVYRNLGHVLLNRDWSMDLETTGTVMAPPTDEVDVAAVLAREGMEEVGTVVEDEAEGLAIVL